MPQKIIYTKYPLLSLTHGYVSCGLIRTEDSDVRRLYRNASAFIDDPAVWEGLFRLACMLTDNPLNEPVAARITAALRESGDGAFAGPVGEQIRIARAGMALFEYSTDRAILKRIGSWCRYLEIEWDHFFSSGRTVFSPADLMELLVCFYRASGIKPVLRLCTKLRASAFDWTSALHTVQQVIPLKNTGEDQISFVDQTGTDGLDYDKKQVLLNHAEMLADGVRYTLFAGMFSGNRQDLTAGKTAWLYLQKHYRALCGGTTAGPFLSGAGSNAGIHTMALCAWAEAFASQMLLQGSEWAVDEMVRLAFNGLSYCLKKEKLPRIQRVNQVFPDRNTEESAMGYARFTRAVAAVYSHAVALAENGVRINYPLSARYLLMIRKVPVMVQCTGDKVRFICKNAVPVQADVFCSGTETAEISLLAGDEPKRIYTPSADTERAGQYIRAGELRCPEACICFEQAGKAVSEETHHRGICWFVRNRLMVYPCRDDDYSFASSGMPDFETGVPRVQLFRIDGWRQRSGEADDIPVLPSYYESRDTVALVPYDQADQKITMFPRINPVCFR